MSLPIALALLALLVAIFAVLAVGGVYARLRLLERTALSANATRLSDEILLAPEAVRPRGDDTAALVFLLDASCAVCGAVLDSVADRVAAGELAGLRVVAAFPARDAANSYRSSSVESVESIADPDVWAALYEGYTPCLFLINQTGRIVHRRFIYGDTNLLALLTELVPTSSSSGSNHAP